MMTPLAQINLNLLVALNVLLEEKNVRRAAERIGVTQSAMSHSLRRLRTLLDDPILVRVGNQMRTTPRAERLKLPLHQALLMLQSILKEEEHFEPSQTKRRFVFAASDGVSSVLLPPLLAVLAQKAPGIDLDVVPLSRTALGQLATGEVDLAFAPSLQEVGLRSRSLYSLDFVILARNDHPVLCQKIDLTVYCRLGHIVVSARNRQSRGVVDTFLARQGQERRVVLQIPYFLVVPALLLETDYLFTTPRKNAEFFAHHFPLSIHPVPFSFPMRKLMMGWHERFHKDPGLTWLRKLLVQLVNTSA